MKSESISIITIILGLIIITFPILGIIGTGAIIGVSLLLMSIYLLVVGVSDIDYNKTRSIINITLGIITLIISLGIMFNPNLFSFLAGITLYLAGLFLIIIGVVTLIGNRENQYGFYGGIIGIILGVIYIIIGTYASDPFILGTLIGIWLLITGILNLINK